MTSRPHLRSAATATALTVLGVLVLGAVPSAGQDGTNDGPPTVAEATAAVEQAEAELDRLEVALYHLAGDRNAVMADLGERDERRQRATRDLVRARTGAQSLAVLAYITADFGTVILGSGPDTDQLYQATLVRDGADARFQAASYYRDLREQADDAVTRTLTGLEGIDAAIAARTADRNVAEDEIRAAATDLEAARAAEEAQEAARRAAAQPAPAGPSSGAGSGPWTPIGTIPGGPTPQQWAQLRNCESGGNYQAVSPGGAYRGAYQFDLSTWGTVGGSGDPISASPAEQDHRAQLLWQSRGHSPWPLCGRFLA